MSIVGKLEKLVGIVPHCQYRDNFQSVQAGQEMKSYDDLSVQGAEQTAEDQASHVVERYKEFAVGHIEFDDQGQYWDPRQIAEIEKELTFTTTASSEKPGVLIVCFMHGWKNNAQHDNGNLQSFREMLMGLAKTEETLAKELQLRPRRIFGVFLSWRGQANSIPFVQELTFWNRKKTAHKVGRGDLVGALSRLEQIRFLDDLSEYASRMIIIGHSFGGAAVFSATGPYIRTVAEGEQQVGAMAGGGKIEKIRGFGDLIILVNPAFEAQLYNGFDALTKNIQGYSAEQHVVLMTVGAENDKATKYYFPVGQYLARWMQKRQDNEQFRRIKTTVANLNDFVTHSLKSTESNVKPQAISKSNAVQSYHCLAAPKSGTSWQDYLPTDANWKIEATREPRMPPNFAFMNVKATKEIVDGHSGIFLSSFIEFVRDFTTAQDAHSYRLKEIETEQQKHGVPRASGMQQKAMA